MDTQQRKIIRYLETYGSITVLEAVTNLCICSPRKRLSELAQQGRIESKVITKTTIDDSGRKHTVRFKRYFLII